MRSCVIESFSARSQNGHWKSANSTTVTLAVALPRVGDLAAAATVCLAVVFLPGGMPFVPRPVLVAAPLCVLPIARFGLAPLALDWNRHR